MSKDDIQDVLADRQETHGSFPHQAVIAQCLKKVFDGPEGWSASILTHMQREALEMIFLKISRIIAGNPNHTDHWDDIAGYAMLVSRELGKCEAEA